MRTTDKDNPQTLHPHKALEQEVIDLRALRNQPGYVHLQRIGEFLVRSMEGPGLPGTKEDRLRYMEAGILRRALHFLWQYADEIAGKPVSEVRRLMSDHQIQITVDGKPATKELPTWASDKQKTTTTTSTTSTTKLKKKRRLAVKGRVKKGGIITVE